MPKIKTHKATAKRFKVTGGGKLRRRKGHASHRDTLRKSPPSQEEQASEARVEGRPVGQ